MAWPVVDSGFPLPAPPQAGPFSPLDGTVSECAQPIAGYRRQQPRG